MSKRDNWLEAHQKNKHDYAHSSIKNDPYQYFLDFTRWSAKQTQTHKPKQNDKFAQQLITGVTSSSVRTPYNYMTAYQYQYQLINSLSYTL